jgi:hypothetical protein
LKGVPLTVGINSVTNNENYQLAYPNPFTNEITLSLQNFSNKAVVEVYNLSGQLLYHEIAENIPSGKIGSELPKGLYMLTITDGNKRVTNKIVKQ